MKTIKLFHICYTDMGTKTILMPSVPESTAEGEDEETPRIPTCLNILSCLTSMEISFNYATYAHKTIPLWIYSADVPIDIVYQPTVNEVPDVWKTGELWVIEPIEWQLESKAYFRWQSDFIVEDNSSHKAVYSTYSFTYDGEKEVDAKIGRPIVYGEANKAFNFIEVNPRALVHTIYIEKQ